MSGSAGPNARDFPEQHFGLAVEWAERAVVDVLDAAAFARFRAIGAELIAGLRGDLSRQRFDELRREAESMVGTADERAARDVREMFSILGCALGHYDLE